MLPLLANVSDWRTVTLNSISQITQRFTFQELPPASATPWDGNDLCAPQGVLVATQHLVVFQFFYTGNLLSPGRWQS